MSTPRRLMPWAVLTAAAVLLVAGCRADTRARQPADGPTAGQAAIRPVSVPPARAAHLPRATTFAHLPAAPRDRGHGSGTGTPVVHPRSPQLVYAAPGSRAIAVLPVKELGGPTWVPVVRTEPGWRRVLLPSRPNHAAGWLYTAGQRGDLDIRYSHYVVRVDTGDRRLTVSRGGRRLGGWTVAVGAKHTPTPTGRTFVLGALAPPHPRYSRVIFPLGTHSDTLDAFGGGPGTVALHGWPDPRVFGHAISHGCIRVPSAALHVLSKVPLGSLVLITG